VIIKTRVPKLVNRYLNYFLLWCGLLIIGFKRILTYLKGHADVLAIIFGLLLFVIPNMASGFMFSEYFVPFLFVLIPIAGIFYEKIVTECSSGKMVFLRLIFIATLVSGLIWKSYSFVDLSGGRLPIEEIRKISSVVKANTNPSDEIYALEALSVVVEANRQAMPGVTLAQFSIYDGDELTAERLHLVNGQMTIDYFNKGIPKVVILTSFDRANFRNIGVYDPVMSSLISNYTLIFSMDKFGQNKDTIELYLLHQ
jgi:hypothetical protein